MIGTLIILRKLRISPDAAFSGNDWTACVILIIVIGGIDAIERPILYFLMRETMTDLGSVCLMTLGLVAILVMPKALRGLWGFVAERYAIELVPVRRRLWLRDKR